MAEFDKQSEDQRLRGRIHRTLVKTVIAIPLLEKIRREETDGRKAEDAKPIEYDVIIDANLDFPGGRIAARNWILQTIAVLLGIPAENELLKPGKNEGQSQYVFARLPAHIIKTLVRCDGLDPSDRDNQIAEYSLPDHLPRKHLPDLPGNTKPERPRAPRAIYQIWEDFRVYPLITKSLATVKADAAHAAFKASGKNIVWAVVDSGIEATHPHFEKFANLQGNVAAWHRDFTLTRPSGSGISALRDEYGHGTHVAGIIAGEISPPTVRKSSSKQNPRIRAFQRSLGAETMPDRKEVVPVTLPLQTISGMAPQTGLVSLKVLGADGSGDVSSIIAALTWIQEINGYGRRIQIHGVNLSVGYPFDAEWFACGQSQLCVEVDRLVRSGVVVVVAAGNRGYGQLPSTQREENRMGGLALSISDPGNAALAITVGSTHREMPHVYGVSYFSGKGPTGDGRLKPDLLAPGEKIISCGVGKLLEAAKQELSDGVDPNYIEYSGTSMAAPHVSGCIASFLSVKREFIGSPDRVKEVFAATATDLGRERSFQGAGLVDLMRAIQYV